MKLALTRGTRGHLERDRETVVNREGSITTQNAKDKECCWPHDVVTNSASPPLSQTLIIAFLPSLSHKLF